jgi:uncharacterized peroxidase-related enzyme
MFITAVPEAEAEGEVADYYRRQTESWGFLPNYAGCFASRPNVAAAWDQLNGAVRGNMDRRRYEIATVAAARALKSTYCTTAHATFIRKDCDDEETFRSLGEKPNGEGLNAQDQAIYAFAGKLAADASSIEQSDVDTLREHGLSDEEVADIVFAAAARSFFTKVLDGLGAQLDAQTAATVPAELMDSFVVGRPPAEA